MPELVRGGDTASLLLRIFYLGLSDYKNGQGTWEGVTTVQFKGDLKIVLQVKKKV